MPVLVNGRYLGVEDNGVFTDANTDPIPLGRLWPEAAATWNAMHTAYIGEGGDPGDFVPAGPNSSSRGRPYQDYVWNLYIHGRGNPAARPYTSNHGWGIAVDVKTTKAAAWILRNGANYGWSHDEGLRVGEWWHMRYIGLSPAQLRRVTKPPSGSWLLPDELRWVREYDRLKRRGTSADAERLQVLESTMRSRRQSIWRAARRVPHGWDEANRRKRYASLLARSR